MQATSIERRIPLPQHWPRRVRSAVVHAVSMANTAFTVTLSHAENHFNARVRLQAENDRLRREVSLLKEEIRIKDARMERVPAQRRPHYPPIERLAILELRAARGWSLAQTARRLLVTPLTIASWTQRLDDEGPVPRQNPIRVETERLAHVRSHSQSRPSASLTPFPHPFIVVRCSLESPSSWVGYDAWARRGPTF